MAERQSNIKAARKRVTRLRVFQILPVALAVTLSGWLTPVVASSESPRNKLEEPAGFSRVLEAQEARIEMIDRVMPAVVCIGDGGSGVLIDEEGFGLTNFHVVGGLVRDREGWGGLNSGKKYDLQVLGIDPTGDVAMFRLLGRDDFPHVPVGDSDAVEVGEPTVAMGNPFSLATDYRPTVTMGIVTGVHRYQWGVGNNLIYSDCIQVDTSINPGNSGGPLFNMAGEVIGINGRISVNTRGRYNVGFGYAISANQIKMFIPGLRAGRLVRHGTLLAQTDSEVDGITRFINVFPGGAAERAGVEPGDVLVAIDHHKIRSANHFVSVMGTYPADRHVRLSLERDGEPLGVIARLDAIEPKLTEPFEPDRDVVTAEVTRVLKNIARAAGSAASADCDWQGAEARADAASLEYAEGVLRVSLRDEDSGRAKRALTWRPEGLVENSLSGGAEFEPPIREQLRFQALGRGLQLLTTPTDDIDLASWDHMGADALYRDLDGKPIEVVVLRWRLSENLAAELRVGRTSNRLERVTVFDKPSGHEAFADFQDYGDENLPWLIRCHATDATMTAKTRSWTVTP